MTKNNQLADRHTELSDIFSNDTESIVLRNKSIKQEEGDEEEGGENTGELKIQVKGTTVKDMIREIKNFYGQDLDAEMTNGKLILYERGGNKGKNLEFELKTLDKDGKETTGIATDYKAEYDQTYFLNQGSKLVGNIPQNLADGSGLANESSRLEDVSGKSLDDSVFNLKLQDHNGVNLSAKIELGEQSYLVLPSKDEGGEPYKIPLYDAKVDDAQSSKAPIQDIADNFIGKFVPFVLIVALLSFIYWYFLASVGAELSIMRAVSVLVIACPCAMGLATPLAVISATNKLSETGIIFKNGEAIERYAYVNDFYFDKTGTITTGNMTVNDQKLSFSCSSVLNLITSAAFYSKHPASKAISLLTSDLYI